MQSIRSVFSAVVFVACCTCASAASANASQGGHVENLSGYSHQPVANASWFNFFGGRGYHVPYHDGGGGRGDCNVPEIPTSGLPSMGALVLGGAAIVLSRRSRRLSE